jgi:hypothetical protein
MNADTWAETAPSVKPRRCSQNAAQQVLFRQLFALSKRNRYCGCLFMMFESDWPG